MRNDRAERNSVKSERKIKIIKNKINSQQGDMLKMEEESGRDVLVLLSCSVLI